MQNPPSVPTIPVCWLYARLFNVKLIIDWHNYGYSIMALNAPKFVTRIYEWIELSFGSRADYHLTVTEALKDDLESRTPIER